MAPSEGCGRTQGPRGQGRAGSQPFSLLFQNAREAQTRVQVCELTLPESNQSHVHPRQFSNPGLRGPFVTAHLQGRQEGVMKANEGVRAAGHRGRGLGRCPSQRSKTITRRMEVCRRDRDAAAHTGGL